MPPAHDLAALDNEEESVRIAVRALGDMRNSAVLASSPNTSFQPTPALSAASRSSSPSSSLRSPTTSVGDNEDMESPDFVSRVSHLPLVNTALRAYEHTKASSRVVKYGAEMMESSVKTISKPVIDRLPVNQLDEFACRQLDRVSYYPEGADQEFQDERERGRSGWSSSRQDPSELRNRGRHPSPDLKGKDRDISMLREDDRPPGSSHSRTPTPRQEDTQQEMVPRSRWQTVLLEAGGIGAAVSEESMRRLKYCLQWLQYATDHIDSQIAVLRDFIASLQEQQPSNGSSLISPQHLHTLTTIRRDVVNTIRQVVDVVSKYAGGALPEPARSRVRDFILHLPQRWAQAASPTSENAPAPVGAKPDGKVKSERVSRSGRTATAPYSYGKGEAGPSPRSKPPSRATSPSHARQTNGCNTAHNGAAMAHAAQKILTLAAESLDMLRAVTQVFKESLDKADAWVERLRIVGLQRPQTLPPPITSSPPSPSLGPSTASPHHYREPLPPIALSPDTSNAPSPSPVSPYFGNQMQLPPIGEALQSQTAADADFKTLNINGSSRSTSMASSYGTPRSMLSAVSSSREEEYDGAQMWSGDQEDPRGRVMFRRDRRTPSAKMDVDG
ncbi:transcription factor Opi1-domain-containing protein [Cristinia sonorae]|uniref:Transcription factor Opi1-domain-containing protein n=1 Tax=Cristinia sonorae TaxID=1940300 RepID=A0A8K0UTN9_9AGAR|nr:transcription factor Opi1-domain-containing protein [Cristinia sonorae]